MNVSIRKVANGYVVEPMDAPGVARDKSKDEFVFQTFPALVEHLAKRFGEVE